MHSTNVSSSSKCPTSLWQGGDLLNKNLPPGGAHSLVRAGGVVFVPYLICILDRPVVGDNHKESLMFYLEDYSSEDLMFKDAFRSMLRRKYNGFTFNCHNLSNFDSNFILKHIFELASVRRQI